MTSFLVYIVMTVFDFSGLPTKDEQPSILKNQDLNTISSFYALDI